MKIRAAVSLFAILMAGAALAEEPAIVHIRAEYQAIRAAAPHMKTEAVEMEATEGGRARAFRDRNGQIRLIKVELDFESGAESSELYYENGVLIFVYFKSGRYVVLPNGIDRDVSKYAEVTEDRYYFNGGQLIRWLSGKKAGAAPGSKEFKQAEEEVLLASNETLARFKAKKK